MKIILPTANIARWTAKAKAAIVEAISIGQISREEALTTYSLTGEELDNWMDKAAKAGRPALRVTRLQFYR
jgi:hypothetical protein